MHLLLLCFVLGLCHYSLAQSPTIKFNHLTAEQGLSSNQIKCLHTDKEGFVWIGTRYGLNRFDGIKFKVYKNRAEDSTSIPDNFIWHIYEAKDDKLWIGTGNGLGVLDKRTGQFTNFYHQKDNPNSLSNSDVREIIEDENSIFWIGTAEGLNSYDLKKQQFTRFQVPNPEKPKEKNAIWGMWIDRKGKFWICTNYGFFEFDKERKAFHLLSQYNYRDARNNFFDVYEDSESYLWLSTNRGGVYRIAPDRKSYENYRPDPKNPSAILGNEANKFREDRHGVVWILHGDLGVSAFNKKTKQFTVYQHDENNPHSLSGERTCGFTEDNSGNIWIGTYQNGLNYFDNRRSGKAQFTTFQHNPFFQKGLRQGSINTIYEDSEGLLWIGVEFKGIDVYNPKTNTYTHYSQDSTNPVGLWENNYFAFQEDKNGNIWLGDWHHTSYFDKQKQQFAHSIPDVPSQKAIFSHPSYTILKDQKNTLWFTFHNRGFAAFWQDSMRSDGKKGVIKFWGKINEKYPLSDISTFIQDKNGQFWFGDSEKEIGVVSFDPQTENFVIYPHENQNPYSPIADEILALADDKFNDWLWIGTRKGLNLMDKKSKRFLLFDEQSGLHDDIIYAIITDHRGGIWLSSPKGIAKLSLDRKKMEQHLANLNGKTPFDKRKLWEIVGAKIRVYDYQDGAITIDNWGLAASHFHNKNGYLYFGGSKGFCKFHPDSIQENRLAPSVVFTSFKLFEQEYQLDTAITYKKSITLAHHQNFLSFEFAALNFIRPDKNQYAYQIEGLNKNWIPLGNKNTVSIAGLEPNRYVLRVKASNNDGVWNEKGATLAITILPPWWKTWWFISLVIIAIGAIGYWFYQDRIDKIRKEEAHKRKEQEMEMRNKQIQEYYQEKATQLELAAANAKIETHFFANCVSAIDTLKMKNQLEEANFYSEKFNKLMRLVLEIADKKMISLSKELEFLSLYVSLQQLRFRDKFDFQLQINEETDTTYLQIPPMLIQPYIENAILHGLRPKKEKGNLLLKITEKEDELTIEVEDDGVGIHESKKQKSINGATHISKGMEITQVRLEKLAQLNKISLNETTEELKDEQGKARGTKVRIEVKY
jgi:ligand-binding sensor domain-containing protein